ncbi:MAG: Rieske (2Fe-2S) protein [Kineosporiaceae bacterium]
MPAPDTTDLRPARRPVVVGAVAACLTCVLGGCSVYGTGAPDVTPAPTEDVATEDVATEDVATEDPATEDPATEDPEGTKGARTAGPAGLAALDDIPVGGGRVLGDRKIVLTRPDAGTVKAFSAICTHAGCAVSAVSDGVITCPCHGSAFSITDGSVTAGPARRPLSAVPVEVREGAVHRV